MNHLKRVQKLEFPDEQHNAAAIRSAGVRVIRQVTKTPVERLDGSQQLS